MLISYVSFVKMYIVIQSHFYNVIPNKHAEKVQYKEKRPMKKLGCTFYNSLLSIK